MECMRVGCCGLSRFLVLLMESSVAEGMESTVVGRHGLRNSAREHGDRLTNWLWKLLCWKRGDVKKKPDDYACTG